MFKFKRISVDDAKQLMDSRQFQLVDIRDDASFEAGHIETAELLNNSNLHDYINRADFDKPLLVCCYHGNSSQSAAQYLAEQGFEEVYSIDGGYEAWKLL